MLSSIPLLAISAPLAAAEAAETAEAEAAPAGEIVITGTRPAYRGEFEELEIPQAERRSRRRRA